MAKVEWEIKGCLKVEDELTNGDLYSGDPNATGVTLIRNLRNVKVKVEASTQKQKKFFKSWGTVTTDELGNFSIKKDKNEKPRHIRIYVNLNNSSLRVIGQHTISEKLVIYESDGRIEGPTVDLGDYTISGSPANRNVPLTTHLKILTWYFCDKLITTLKAEGPEYAFKRKVHVKVNASTLGRAPWARGIGMSVIYIQRQTSQFLVTLYHEIIHIWDYHHNTGTTNWLAHFNGKLIDGGIQYEPYVAFHEGFAEFAAYEIIHHLLGREKYLPYTISEIASNQNIDSLERIERSAYVGVISGLRLLTAENPGMLVLKNNSTPTRFALVEDRGCPANQLMTFWDVLRVFSPGPGWETNWQVGNREYGLFRFFDRAADIIDTFPVSAVNVLIQTLDPSTGYETFSHCDELSNQTR